jgi:hypothetical protein
MFCVVASRRPAGNIGENKVKNVELPKSRAAKMYGFQNVLLPNCPDHQNVPLHPLAQEAEACVCCSTEGISYYWQHDSWRGETCQDAQVRAHVTCDYNSACSDPPTDIPLEFGTKSDVEVRGFWLH